MIKTIIGMMKWKRLMKKYRDMPPYTDEWWALMRDSLLFLPENQRQMIIDSIVGMAAVM